MKQLPAIIIALTSLLVAYWEHQDRTSKQQLQWDYVAELHRNTGAPASTLPGWK